MSVTSPAPTAVEENGGGGGAAPRGIQIVFAFALLLIFVVLGVWMLLIADDSESAWDRRIYIFGSVEALVFTAVGWIFGREVHRVDAEKANADADKSKKEAKAAQDAASDKREEAATERVKGQALAAAVETAAISPGAGAGRAEDAGLGGSGPVSASQLTSLQALSRRLYGSG